MSVVSRPLSILRQKPAIATRLSVALLGRLSVLPVTACGDGGVLLQPHEKLLTDIDATTLSPDGFRGDQALSVLHTHVAKPSQALSEASPRLSAARLHPALLEGFPLTVDTTLNRPVQQTW